VYFFVFISYSFFFNLNYFFGFLAQPILSLKFCPLGNFDLAFMSIASDSHLLTITQLLSKFFKIDFR